MLKICRSFDKIDLHNLKFEMDFEKDLKLDSLEVTALVVSIEEEFHTVFEDNVFENFKNLNQIITFLSQDHMVF